MALRHIALRNVLSFGAERQELPLQRLNVLIGPNSSGKSNVIEILGLVKQLRSGFWRSLLDAGGPAEWLWQDPGAAGVGTGPAEIELKIDIDRHETASALVYRLAFGTQGIESEHIHAEHDLDQGKLPVTLLVRSADEAHLYLPGEELHGPARTQRKMSVGVQDPTASHFRDPVRFPELAQFSDLLQNISLHRDWAFGRGNPFRQPQKPDFSSAFPSESLGNLGLVLNRLAADPEAKRRLIEELGRLCADVKDFDVRIELGRVEIFVREGRRQVPATRLSDGTLRYLWLLSILCHPHPPWLVCLDEPELGLHPDILPGVADLLREASERCQLVVTTHSEVLVDALTDTPESVVVCERHDGRTTLRRLEASALAHWLESYRLGELWSTGRIGGNRW